MTMSKRLRIAEHGARRPPQGAVDVGRMRDQPFRLQRGKARQAAVGEDRRDLQADDEGGADHRGDDLRDEPRALGADDAEQGDGERDASAAATSPMAATTP